MKRTVVILVVLFSSIAFSSPKSGDDSKKTNNSEFVEQLVPIVTSVLQGKDITEFRENISPEAYVINNNTYESIFEVLGNDSKKEMFVEGKEIKVGSVHLRLTENQKEAYMVLRTKSADNTKTSWHSILFRIGENNKWQILSWHKS
ncbi:MAG: hypothetical protein Q8N03_04795 [Ignavibacteria bacterium]|nr:hypothetical protein [Ignavibacteria bacterium]MDP3830672.1 hypothetical protein [Ignavibacteriaceae bacterium]